MKKRAVTIVDLAKHLHISKSTVSRALRDRYDINPETRELVLKAAKELGYRPNTMAVNLKKNMSFTIGVIIPSFQIPFYAGAISGIQETCSKQGYNIIICQSNESREEEKRAIETLLNSRVDGLLISVAKSTSDYSHIYALKESGLPLVLFNRVCPDQGYRKVLVNDYEGAQMVVSHLISTGRRRIAHITGPMELLLCQNRDKGFRDTLRENSVDIDENLVMHGDFTIESGQKIAGELLEKTPRPEAIFCTCDAMAFGAMLTLKKHHIRIPEDIAIAGFTNEPVAALVDPPLTTIAQPICEIGRTAAEAIFDQIRNPDDDHTGTTEMETRLIIRESTVKKKT